MDKIQDFLISIKNFIGTYIVPEWLLVYSLLGTGLFLTFRLGFIQFRHLKHGFLVATGRYDDPNEPGDVSHFQALTTALSATVGVGNIAGVALAIHWGGPGAVFWMWMTALLGMAVKYSEVTLALEYRTVSEDKDPKAWEGSVAGGPMYYIERGLGKNWKFLAVIFASGLMLTSFLTGNAVQANTLTDIVVTEFDAPKAVVAIISCIFVSIVIFGGIKRIGKVTSILAPAMGIIYFVGAIIILIINAKAVPGAFISIFTEAFNPTSGVAGVGMGVFMTTMMYGVKRGLFSNEAGQGSAPVAHSAAKTDEPVSEGVVALLEPFIDTIIICTLTALVVVATGAWSDRHPTEMSLSSGDLSYVKRVGENSYEQGVTQPESIRFVDGVQDTSVGTVQAAWHEVYLDKVFVDEAQTVVFNGEFLPAEQKAVSDSGEEYMVLYSNASESGAPLTSRAFESQLGAFGKWIVILCVVLFALSTAISWSYYGDRCAFYLFGRKAVIPYKVIFVGFHFLGAMISLQAVWDMGDVALSVVTMPNLIALLLLSGTVVKLTRSYFDRRAWEDNEPKS